MRRSGLCGVRSVGDEDIDCESSYEALEDWECNIETAGLCSCRPVEDGEAERGSSSKMFSMRVWFL